MANIQKEFKYKRAISVTYGAMFYEGAMNVILISLMPLLSQRYGVSTGDMGLLISAKSIGTFFMLYVSGYWSDKYGRKPVIFSGAICMLFFILGLIVSNNFYLAIIFAFMGGIGHGIMDAPSMSIIFDLFPSNPAPGMSLVQVFFSGGGVAVTITTAQILKYGLDWRLILYAFAFIGVALAFLTYSAVFPPKYRLEPDSSGTAQVPKYKSEPLLKKEGAMLAICMAFFAVYQAVVFTWMPTFAEAGKGLSEADSLSVLTVYQIGTVIGALVFSQVLRKIHATQVMILNSLMTLLLFVGFLWVTTLTTIFIVTFLMGIFMGIFFSLCINMGGELFSEKAGTMTGLLGTVNMLTNSISLIVSGQLIKVIGITSIYQFVPVFLIGLVGSTLVFRRMYKKLI